MKEVIIRVKYDDKLGPVEDIVPEIIKDGFEELCRMNRLKLPEFEILNNTEKIKGVKKCQIKMTM